LLQFISKDVSPDLHQDDASHLSASHSQTTCRRQRTKWKQGGEHSQFDCLLILSTVQLQKLHLTTGVNGVLCVFCLSVTVLLQIIPLILQTFYVCSFRMMWNALHLNISLRSLAQR